MDSLQFFSTVRVARGKGHPIEEIDSVQEAMVFLREWPVGTRGPVYRCALNCCSAAMAAQMKAWLQPAVTWMLPAERLTP